MKRKLNFDIVLMIIVIIYNLLLIGFSLSWLFTNKLDYIKTDLFCNTNNNNNLPHLSYFFFAGIIGGSFYCLRSFYQRLSDAYTPQHIKKIEDLPDPALVFNIRVWFF